MNSYHQDEQKMRTQEKLYKTLEKLKGMARKVPPKYQSRLSFEMLSSLAALLMDDTVVQIIAELTELQHMAESHLHQTRCNITSRHKAEQERVAKEHKVAIDKAKCGGRHHAIAHLLSTQRHAIDVLRARHEEEVRRFNAEILHSIDKKVVEQQKTLMMVGVPGFFETTNPVDVKVQQYIIDFILQLHKHNPALINAFSS